MEKLKKIRKPAVAGAFYPGSERELKLMINQFLDEAQPPKIKGKLKALIVPHAGYIYSGPVAATVYKLLRQTHGREQFTKVFLLGPSHQALFTGAAIDESDLWETPLGLCPKIQNSKFKIQNSEILFFSSNPHLYEHCLEVQLPFLQVCLKNFAILPILTGKLNPKDLASDLEKLIDKETILIISSDLSHYLPSDQAKEIDQRSCKAIEKINIEEFKKNGDACGKKAISTLLYLAKEENWQAKLLDYRNSGDTVGDKSKVVGYAAFAFTKEG